MGSHIIRVVVWWLIFLVTISCSTTKVPLDMEATIPTCFKNKVKKPGSIQFYVELAVRKKNINFVHQGYSQHEMYLLSIIESCRSNQPIHCEKFLKQINQYRIGNDLDLKNLKNLKITEENVNYTQKNYNNKLIAIISAGLYFLNEPLSNLNINWLRGELQKNSFFANRESIMVQGESYSFSTHNMPSTSARAHCYLGFYLSDDSLIKKCHKIYREIVNYSRLDGSFPLEARRGARAIRYSMQVMSDLVAIRYYFQRFNKLESISEQDKKLYRIVDYTLKLLAHPGEIYKYAKDNKYPSVGTDYTLQDMTSLRSRLAWLVLVKVLRTDNVKEFNFKKINISQQACKASYNQKTPLCMQNKTKLHYYLQNTLGFTLGFNPKCFSL